jgi:hypothetical protein
MPPATSVAGRRCSLHASLHGLDMQARGYVVVEGRDSQRAGCLPWRSIGSLLPVWSHGFADVVA